MLPPQLLTTFRHGWKITLMVMAVLFMFTACEVDDPAVKAPEKIEESTDLSSMSISELDAYYMGLDRSQMNEKHSDLIVKKIERPTKLKVRSRCSLDIKIDLDDGTATLFYWYVDIAGSGGAPTYSGTASPGSWVNVTNSFDDTKDYDIFVDPIVGENGAEEYWVILDTPGTGYSFTMLTWNQDRQAYWWGLDKLTCN